jgi:hypothetical protein
MLQVNASQGDSHTQKKSYSPPNILIPQRRTEIMDLIEQLSLVDLNQGPAAHQRKIMMSLAEAHASGKEQVPFTFVALNAGFDFNGKAFLDAFFDLVGHGMVLFHETGSYGSFSLSTKGMRQILPPRQALQ